MAIKILPSRFSANKDYIKRFQQEGKAAAKLNHPNIVAAVDVGSWTSPFSSWNTWTAPMCMNF